MNNSEIICADVTSKHAQLHYECCHCFKAIDWIQGGHLPAISPWLSIIVLCYSEPGLNAAGSSWYISVLLAWQFSAELCSLLPDTINLLFHIYSGIGHWAHVVIFLKLLTAGTSVFDSSPLMCFMWFILFIMFLESTAVNENKTTLSGGCKEMQCEENVAVLCYSK